MLLMGEGNKHGLAQVIRMCKAEKRTLKKQCLIKTAWQNVNKNNTRVRLNNLKHNSIKL